MSSKFRVKDVPYVKEGINLCKFKGFSCFGCCGYEFKGKDKAAESIYKQTKEYEQYMGTKSSRIDHPATKFNRVEFRERNQFHDLNSCNFCRNLILDESQSIKTMIDKKKLDFTCPLHPATNDGTDLRAGHCDTDYMCRMQMSFHKMTKNEKEKFLAWLEERINQPDIDWYAYSVNMDTDVFYKEYKAKK